MSSSRFVILLSLLLLTSCAAVQSPTLKTEPPAPQKRTIELPAACVARRLPVKAVWVAPDAAELVGEKRISLLLDAWGFVRVVEPQLAGAWIVLQADVFIPFTSIPYEPNQPVRVVLGPPTADRMAMVSHELCHVASRSSCHLDSGLCAATITSSTDPYPTQKELDLKLAPLLVK